MKETKTKECGLLASTAVRRRYVRLFAIMFCMAIVGCLMIFNVTRGTSSGSAFFRRQLVWTLCGGVVAGVILMLPLKLLRQMFSHIYIIWYMSLLGLFVFGSVINGSRGWYRFAGFCIQPGEVGKPLFICFMAFMNGWIKHFRNQWIRLAVQVGLLAVVAVPLALQPDFGTLLVYCLTFLAIIFYDGVPWRQLLTVIGGGIAGCVTAICSFRYVQLRFLSFCQSFIGGSGKLGYHAACLQDCLVKGGWTGILLDGYDALVPLPYRYSDSLFAGAGELLGAMGMIPVVLLSFAWLMYCFFHLLREKRHQRQIIFLGGGVMVTVQAFVHFAVNLGLMPNTGITLPFFSYGGSSLISSMAIMALVERLAAENDVSFRQASCAQADDASVSAE